MILCSFEKCMRSDIKALKYESQQMGEYLLEQARNERIFLLMNGTDRKTGEKAPGGKTAV